MSDSEAEVERPATESNASGSRQEANGQIILDDPIIDLTDPEATWERVEKDLNPFERLDKPARMRLMIQVLCELVAFDELEEGEEGTAQPEVAGADATNVTRLP